MKKITFILLAFIISGSAFAQDAKGTADVFAEIVTPITINDGSALNFGSIVAAEGGKVRVSTGGTRTFSNNNMEVISGEPVAAASFTVNAADQFSYNVYIPSTQLTDPLGGGTAMPVSFSQNVGGDIDGNVTGSGQDQTLYVGGLLTVAAGQAAGNYEGTVTVTVAYE